MRRGKKWMAALGAAALVMAALSGCGSSTATQTTAGSQAAQETQESKETSGGETTAAATEETKNVNDDGTVNNPEQVAVDSNKLVMWSLFSGGDGGFMENISLEDLCRLTGLSKYYLLRSFTKQKGISPYSYLETIRIDKAKKLLEQGILPIDAALQTGFTDQSHFSNFFKKFIGLTPKQYMNIFKDI